MPANCRAIAMAKPSPIIGITVKRGQASGYQTGRSPARKTASEDGYNRRFCAAVGGLTETRHTYTYEGGSSYVKIDCETDTTVYEGGLDKRSSLDSLQQALFFSALTGKRPGGGDL